MKFYKRLIILTLVVIFLITATYYYIGGYKKYFTEAEKCAYEHGVSLPLILAVMKTESGFNPSAVSTKGAIGLMQIMPSTSEFMCKINGIKNGDLFLPDFNILIGTLYLKYLIEKFNSERLAILAYNAGEGRVAYWIENGLENEVPFTETRLYYKKVIARKTAYKAVINISKNIN